MLISTFRRGRRRRSSCSFSSSSRIIFARVDWRLKNPARGFTITSTIRGDFSRDWEKCVSSDTPFAYVEIRSMPYGISSWAKLCKTAAILRAALPLWDTASFSGSESSAMVSPRSGSRNSGS